MCNECIKESLNDEIEYINWQTREYLDWEKASTLPDNTMLKVNPHLWIEWNFEKNNELGFDIWKIKKSSNKKVWWICPKCKSLYDASLNKRDNGRNCPYCTGKRVNHTNSLYSLKPELASQWHPTLNGELTPHDIPCNYTKKIWWYCFNCESSWNTSPNQRNRKQDCPYCVGKKVNNTNSLATLNPKLASEWHPTKNIKTANDVTCFNNEKFWWLGECGHEWEATVASRNRRDGQRGCPYCDNKKILVGYNDMWTTNPELARLLANPEDGYCYAKKSNIKLNWKCPSCNLIIEHVAPSTVSQFGLVCRQCSTKKSIGEKIMNALLQIICDGYFHDKTTEWSDSRRYDFYIPSLNIIIETHGVQHFKESRREGARNLKEEQTNDQYKYELAIAHGIKPENYIVIDCRRSDFDFIKNNILNSRLAEIFELSNIDWNEIFKSYNNPKAKSVCEDFNKGITNRDYLAKKHGIHRSTVYQYLKKGTQIGWCS